MKHATMDPHTAATLAAMEPGELAAMIKQAANPTGAEGRILRARGVIERAIDLYGKTLAATTLLNAMLEIDDVLAGRIEDAP